MAPSLHEPASTPVHTSVLHPVHTLTLRHIYSCLPTAAQLHLVSDNVRSAAARFKSAIQDRSTTSSTPSTRATMKRSIHFFCRTLRWLLSALTSCCVPSCTRAAVRVTFASMSSIM